MRVWVEGVGSPTGAFFGEESLLGSVGPRCTLRNAGNCKGTAGLALCELIRIPDEEPQVQI